MAIRRAERFRRLALGAALASLIIGGVALLGVEVVLARQGCVTGFDPQALNVSAAGNSDAVNPPPSVRVLTATGGCQWSFSNPPIPSWMAFFPTAAPGPFTISFSVQPNMDMSPRSAVLMFDGRPLTVTQAGNPCPLTLSSAGTSMPANGGQASFTVNTPGTACTYSVAASGGVTIVSGGSGSTYPATVTFSVPANTTGSQTLRIVQVSIVGHAVLAPVFNILQNGPPVATDAPSGGLVFAHHRGLSGGPHATAPELIRITNSENPTASWTATVNEPWLVVSPASGTSPATAVISIDPAAAAVLSPGSYTGTVTLTSSIAPSVPSRVPAVLRITDTSSITTSPLGVVDIPLHNATGLNGAVPIGGWALDDVGIRRVQIYRSPVPPELQSEIYLGDATRVRGARPDVGLFYTTPETTRAGWGFMLLSNVLPNGGNGTYTLSAYAEDIEGRRTLIGQKTVTFDNTNSALPFGTIDQPSQGGNLSGMAAPVAGWVLAQPGRSIPFDGSTIQLLIDGVVQPNIATYGVARPDVAGFFPFPTYANANGAGAHFILDTRQFVNGLHTIAWVARDDQGVVEGIGSRYFTIANGALSQAAAPEREARSAAAIQALPQATAFVWNRQGFDNRRWALQFAGGRTNEIRQAPGERLEITLDTWWWSSSCGTYEAHLLKGDVAGPLPPGASIDGETGVFSWLPPIEFGGTFEFVFVRRACSGREERIPLRVIIESR